MSTNLFFRNLRHPTGETTAEASVRMRDGDDMAYGQFVFENIGYAVDVLQAEHGTIESGQVMVEFDEWLDLSKLVDLEDLNS